MTTFTDQKTSSAYGIYIIQMILWLCYNDVYNNGPSSGFLLPESNMIKLNVMGFKSAYYSTQTQDTYIMLCGLVFAQNLRKSCKLQMQAQIKINEWLLGYATIQAVCSNKVKVTNRTNEHTSIIKYFEYYVRLLYLWSIFFKPGRLRWSQTHAAWDRQHLTTNSHDMKSINQ